MAETAGDDLRILVQNWANENPELRTIKYLSRKSGVDYSTTTRIWNGKNPECQNALAVLHVVCPKEQALAYLKIHFPLAAKFHEKELTTTPVFSDAEAIKPVLENVLSFLIVNFSYARLATKEHITKTYGSMGLEIANSLVKAERLFWQGERLLPTDHSEFFVYESKEDLIKACQHIVSLSASENGYPVALIGNLTDEKHEKLKLLIREFCGAAKELIYSSEGGQNLVALATVYNILSDKGV